MNNIKISIIVAHDLNNGIGIKNSLPWKIKEDLRRFKKITENNSIIMGANTFKSIGCRPLKNRNNIVISSKMITDYLGEIDSNIFFENGHVWVNSIQLALKSSINWSIKNNREELFIIGGDSIYRQFIDLCDKLYITLVNAESESDSWFIYDINKWNEIDSVPFSKNDENDHDGIFKIMEKKCN